MRNNEDDVVPSTSTLLFPDLLTRKELLAILEQKFKRIGVSTSKVVKHTDDELLEEFKKFAMPKPQRKGCIFRDSLNKLEDIKDSDNSGKVSLNELKNSGSACSRVISVGGQRITAYGKRCNDCSTEYPIVEKNARKHSPIRFP